MPHDRPPQTATIIDVARLAGVSKSTVSRVIRDQEKVAPLTREKVLAAARELHYTPDQWARRLRQGPAPSIGLVISTVDIPIFAKLNRYLHEKLRDRGYHVVQEMVLEYDESLIRSQIDNVQGLHASGIILAVGSMPDELLLTYSSRVPLLYLGAPTPELPIENIAWDSKSDGRLIVDHLYEMGHRHIVIQTEQKSHSRGTWARTTAAYVHSQTLGMTASLVDVFDIDDVDTHVRSVLRQGATAVVCAYDSWLFETWRAAKRCGLRVPEDLSLVGSDGVADGLDLLGATTVRHPVDQLATLAANRIVELVENPDLRRGPAQQLYLPGELLEGSVRRLPPATP
ncbi:LacI family DNA-binding transcriptional regulator [Corynebacterium uterequi]|uniref:Transcriptional regulator, LacI family n=1 Tax=Corynebacterium uterequi TaxID=1072256 RepID=A0A0G3HFY3_9CORY|nr:LacI family DNA-binding transcriptional regulator [Corynebacterium uterequi]AKK11635.1 transcriptional regulator, LacI family [Corynebacterium uterequi]